MMTPIETTACIAGGGPAGMMLGWLLARAGVDVVVLEKHRDFFRDFRGDTIHASTMDVIAELGALDEFLRVPHSEIDRLEVLILGERVPGPDLSRLPTRKRCIAMMPQWDFLDFVRAQAERLPHFHLHMEAQVGALLRDGDRVAGVRLVDGREIRARLVVGCDGRHSTVRAAAGLPTRDLGAPIDVLWFRLPRSVADGEPVFAVMSESSFLVMLDRGDYWQCAFIIEKGGLAALRARGLPAFHADLVRLAPFLADRVAGLADWDDLKLLTVVVDRLERWAAPGLLCVGDAAHAMSPVGGVGINLAIQDAVAAANLLWRPLLAGTPTLDQLLAVQARREPATIKTQSLQLQTHKRLLAKVARGRAGPTLRLARLLLRLAPPLRRYLAHAVAVGFTPEHVESPAAPR